MTATPAEIRDRSLRVGQGPNYCVNCRRYYAILCWPHGPASEDSSGTREVFEDQICDLHETGDG